MEKLNVDIAKRIHYFRSVSELKGCKHGGYLEGTITFPLSTKKIELSLITSNKIDGANWIHDPLTQKLVREIHCNLLYVSSSSSNHRPDISKLTESAWRVRFERRGDKMILDRHNHSYMDNEDDGIIRNDDTVSMRLGSKGLRITIVKPLFKENKANRPGIYVSDVLKKRFQECLNETDRFTAEDKNNLQSKFEEFELNNEDDVGQESYLIKNGGMYKAHLMVKCTLEDGTTLTGISKEILASNKYAIEVEAIHQNHVLTSGICQSFFVAFRKCEPTLKMSIKAGFKCVPRNECNELVPNANELIRVINVRRMCKGYGVDVTFQVMPDFYKECSNEMQLFLVLKVFENPSLAFENENYQFIEETEISRFIEHNCDFHLSLCNNIPGHRTLFKSFLLDKIDSTPLPCGLCLSHILPAITNLQQKNGHKPKGVTEEQSLADEDFNMLYERIFNYFFNAVENKSKRPRLHNRNEQLGGYAI